MMGQDFEQFFRRRWREERPARWPAILAVVAVGFVLLAIELALDIRGWTVLLVQLPLEVLTGVLVMRRQWRVFDRRNVGRDIGEEWLTSKRERAPWN